MPSSGEDSDGWKDLQFQDSQSGLIITGDNNETASTVGAVNAATVTIDCYDYGAFGLLVANANIACTGDSHVATPIGGANLCITIPRDEDENHIADAWTYNAGGKDNDTDASLNNSYVGDGLTRYEEYRGVDFDADLKSDRLNPERKDLFVQGNGFGGGFPSFAYGNAFAEAQINVHDFIGTVGTDDRSIDVLVVTAYNGTAEGNSGNIGRSGPPVAGVRQWYWATQGQSNVGTATQYGSSIGFTRVYKVAINNHFYQKPYEDNNTWNSPGVWTGSANGKLDPVAEVEDTNDDGILDGNERDGSSSSPHDDGDNDFDGDYPVVSGTSWDYGRDLTPHDIDNDGEIELPLAAQVQGILYEYDIDHVVMHVCTHEMGHSLGQPSHCSDPSCLMYNGAPNYNRHGHLCDACRATIRIHND